MEPWCAKLADGEVEAAWDLFVRRYRRLILATIRRILRDDEDVLDAFADVCQALSADDLARLRRYRDDTGRARFSTWLVTVVHNRVVDWMRRRDGRPRAVAPASLSPVQGRIYQHVFVEGRSHAEAYELVRAAAHGDLTFGSFLKELAETYRAAERDRGRGAWRHLAPPPPWEPTQTDIEARLAAAEMRAPLARALDSLPPADRLAVQLYVVAGLPAEQIARMLDWPNAKAVYNHVYRALAALRRTVEDMGIGPDDL